jgi:hypothetical protein
MIETKREQKKTAISINHSDVIKVQDKETKIHYSKWELTV